MNPFNKGSYQKGKEFENYIDTNIFKTNFLTVEKTHDSDANKTRPIESDQNPDYKYRCRVSEKLVWVEAKWRGDFYDDKINLTKNGDPSQFNKFKNLDKDIPVFYAIGLRGTPSSPDKVAIIPVREMKEAFVSRNDFQNYELRPIRQIEGSYMNLKREVPVVKIKTHQKKQSRFLSQPYLIAYMLVVVLLIVGEFYFSNKDISIPKVESGNVQQLIFDYYNAAENGDLNYISSHLNDTLIFWYRKNNILKSTVINEIKKYNLDYPERKAEIVDGSFESSTLGNGITQANYLLNYSYRRKGTEVLKSVRLKIQLLMKAEKIIGMNEEKIN